MEFWGGYLFWAMDLLDSLSWAMDWLGSLSLAMDWGGTISLKAWIRAGPSHFEAWLSLFGMGQPHHVSDVLSLDWRYLSMCTFSAGWV